MLTVRFLLIAIIVTIECTTLSDLIQAAAPKATIDATIPNLRNTHGQVICTLFNSPDGFPDASKKAITISVPIKSRPATCQFNNVPYGTYAIVSFHDENHDGKFNQNWLGMPQEGFGFSDNPSVLRKPTFESCRFTVNKPEVKLDINLNYWF